MVGHIGRDMPVEEPQENGLEWSRLVNAVMKDGSVARPQLGMDSQSGGSSVRGRQAGSRW